ncbi:hypothetical protein An02g02050 [Aspergillus niger]|uniref:Uncharacterized protein n=2 Tax=Aspergillus niger TaxID=5061 RepID=A2QC26_ASPNC|nr:hypothetical protein An02g02050 [Aspergillus niger]CAK37507.1 hypothetical protein An02g02050 [Aspergillus niger]
MPVQLQKKKKFGGDENLEKVKSVELVRRTDQRGGERQTARWRKADYSWGNSRTHLCVFEIEIWKEAGGGLRVEVENKNARRSRVEIRRSKGSRVPGRKASREVRFDPTISSYPKIPPNLEFDGAFPGRCVAITSPDKPTTGYCHAETVTGGLAANALVSLDVFHSPAFSFLRIPLQKDSDLHPYRTPTSTPQPEARIPSQLYSTSTQQYNPRSATIRFACSAGDRHVCAAFGFSYHLPSGIYMDDACGLVLFPIQVDCSCANTYSVGVEPLRIPDEREQSPAVYHSSRQNADLSTAIHGALTEQGYNFQKVAALRNAFKSRPTKELQIHASMHCLTAIDYP